MNTTYNQHSDRLENRTQVEKTRSETSGVTKLGRQETKTLIYYKIKGTTCNAKLKQKTTKAAIEQTGNIILHHGPNRNRN